MWVECKARIAHKRSGRTGVAVAAALRDHVPALRRAADATARDEARRRYREASEHRAVHGKQYAEAVLAVEDTPSERVYWLEGPLWHDSVTIVRVSEMHSAPMRADVFALRAFHELENSLPFGYKIVDHQLRMGDISHRFHVVRESVKLPVPELMALLLTILVWTTLKSRTQDTAWIRVFMDNVLANAVFTGVTVTLAWAYRWIRSRSTSRVVYLYG